MNFEELKKQILAMLIAAGKDALGEVESDFKRYAKNLAAWATEAVQTNNKALLDSVLGQAKLLAVRNQIQIQRKLLATLSGVLEIAMTAAFALLKGF